MFSKTGARPRPSADIGGASASVSDPFSKLPLDIPSYEVGLRCRSQAVEAVHLSLNSTLFITSDVACTLDIAKATESMSTMLLNGEYSKWRARQALSILAADAV
jgi:hypothetical protein